MSSMANIRELLIKHRKVQRAKDADRLQPKMGSGRLDSLHGRVTRIEAPPVDDTEPNLLVVIYVKQGKPVFLLFFYRKVFVKENR